MSRAKRKKWFQKQLVDVVVAEPNQVNPDGSIVIDPTHINEYLRSVVANFLLSKFQEKELKIEGGMVYEYQAIKFKFKNPLVWRAQKPEGRKRKLTRTEGLHFEVLERVILGSGSFGTVMPSKGTLIVIKRNKRVHGGLFRPDLTKDRNDNYTIIFKPSEKKLSPRIAKESNDMQELQRESAHLELADLHSSKSITYTYYGGHYLFMKKLEKKTLAAMLAEALDTDMRLRLCIALLETYQNQIERYHIIHNDLKPANIMIALSDTNEPIVNYIDFGSAVTTNKRVITHTVHRTMPYAAPELLAEDGDTLPGTIETEIYSLGRILAGVWGQTLEYGWVQAAMAGEIYSDLTHLHGSNYDTTTKIGIQAFLKRMINPDPTLRPSINEALDFFRGIKINYKMSNMAPK